MVKVLLCEDEQENVELIESLFNKLNQDFNLNFEICHFETKEDSLSALSEDFELAIIDIKLPTNAISGEIDDAAGIKIMDAIVDKYFSSKNLPIPIFQYTNYPDDFMNSFKEYTNRFSGEYFLHLPYKSKPDLFFDKNIELILSALELVQFTRIKQIAEIGKLESLLNSLQKEDSSNNILFGDTEWKVSDYIFQETKFNGRLYFNKKEIIKQIENRLNFTHPSGIGNWANPIEERNKGPKKKESINFPVPIDLVEVYQYFISTETEKTQDRLKQLDEIPTEILHNRIKCISDSNTIKTHTNKIVASPVKVYSFSEKLPERFFNLLIYRKAVLGLVKYLKSINRNLSADEIFELCTDKNSSPDANGKFSKRTNFFSFLGFNANPTIYSDCFDKQKCFKEENIWLEKFSF